MNKSEKREAEHLRDVALIQQHKSGDARAFTELIKPYRTPLYWYIYKKLGNREEAEDAMQEVFLRAFEAIRNGTYKENVPFGGWLHITARNCVEHIIKMPKLNSERMVELPEVMEEEEEAEIQERIKWVRSLFKGLSLKEAKLMLLRYWYGLKWKEIAERLGITEKGASGEHSKILNKFKKNVLENIFSKNRRIF